MRTTLSLDDDVLSAAKAQAGRENRSLGEVVSELARRGLEPRAAPRKMRNGITLLPRSQTSKPVTADIVRQLRDELP
ncbi:MAG: CopG family transcriptional regulator [Proteobacteria bacterium]|nr:CopG family transcriptional regulator [Pseudomonadota bacterium]